VGYLAIALVLVAGGLAYGLMSSLTPTFDRDHDSTCSAVGRARPFDSCTVICARQPGFRGADPRLRRSERHRCCGASTDIPHARSGRRSDGLISPTS
jgi:hypothetical protein